MQSVGGHIELSAADLVGHLSCRHLTQLDLAVATGKVSYLDEIKTSSSTIKSGAEKILARVETMRSALLKQIETLDAQAGLLRQLVG